MMTFADTEPSLHPWNKSHLILVYDPFYICVKVVLSYTTGNGILEFKDTCISMHSNSETLFSKVVVPIYPSPSLT